MGKLKEIFAEKKIKEKENSLLEKENSLLEKEKQIEQKEKELNEKIKVPVIDRNYISNSKEELLTLVDKWRYILKHSSASTDKDFYISKIKEIERELHKRDYEITKSTSL